MKFAVFDIDGTLIRWQLYHTVVDRLAKQKFLGAKADHELHDARMKWKRRETNEGFSEYEKVLIRIFEEAVHTVPTNVFDEVTESVIEEYKDQVYTYTRDLIQTLRRKKYFLIAISGSHEELVQRIASHYKFDVAVGSTYSRANRKFTGESYIASHHKKEILEDLISYYNLNMSDSYAVGDSLSDAPMLEMAENPVAFNPDKKLFDHAKQHHWHIVIERKNVIYTLQYKDDTYVLA